MFVGTFSIINECTDERSCVETMVAVLTWFRDLDVFDDRYRYFLDHWYWNILYHVHWNKPKRGSTLEN